MAIEDRERKEFVGEKQKNRTMGIHTVPPWLIPLLAARFFTHCNAHAESNKNECNLYCLDCTGDPICSCCLPHHVDHRIVQIRRSSYRNVVKVSEISEFIDISGVQTYIINSAKIVFLDERPQGRPFKGVIHACQTCCRPLLESHRFCSIGCKVRGISREQRATIAPGGQSQRSEPLRRSESDEISECSERSMAKVKEECLGVTANVRRDGDTVESVSSVAIHRRSRRKGIPRRTTF